MSGVAVCCSVLPYFAMAANVVAEYFIYINTSHTVKLRVSGFEIGFKIQFPQYVYAYVYVYIYMHMHILTYTYLYIHEICEYI